MNKKTKSYLRWIAHNDTPRRFLRGARCTNVNTFGILPSSPAISSGE